MRPLAWAAWHLARGHPITVGRPYDAPIGTVLRCRCGDRHRLI
ncbi:hypothetical protein ACWIDS_16115 [Dietzia maris]